MTQQTRTMKARWVFALAVIAVIALFWAAVGIASLFGAEDGTTPDWVAAIATLAAFGAAAVAAWYAHRALVLEQKRDRDREARAMRTQAELMTVWPEKVIYGIDMGGVTEENEDTLQVQTVDLRIRNGSHLPISNLHLEVMHYVLGEPEARLLCEKTMPFARPSGMTAEGFAGGVEIARLIPPPDRARGAYVRLTFTDAAGQRWRREGMDDLEPI